MKVDRLLAILAMLSIFLPVALAENAVILTTNISYADFAVGSVVGEKIGAPVFSIPKDKIPAEVMEEIEALDPDQIYIIGGPAVISNSIEKSLEEKYNVTRIWGMSRFGTSVEVAKYFWPEGVDKAVIAFDFPDIPTTEKNPVDIVISAKELAIEEEVPLILVPYHNLPLEVEETLKELGVSQVILVGNGEEEVKVELENLSIKVRDWKREPLEIQKEILMKIVKRAKSLVPLVVAAKRWEERMSTPFVPGNSSVIIVSNESQIDDLIEMLKEMNVSKVKVVGNPELAEKIRDALKKEGFELVVSVGNPLKLQVRWIKEHKEELAKLSEKYKKIKERIKELLLSKAEKIEERCLLTYNRTKAMLESLNASQDAMERLEVLKEKCLNYSKIAPIKALKLRGRIAQIGKKEVYDKWKVEKKAEPLKNILDNEMVSKKVILNKIKKILKKAKVSGKKEFCKELKIKIEKLKSEGKYFRARLLNYKFLSICKGAEGIKVNVSSTVQQNVSTGQKFQQSVKSVKQAINISK